MKLLITTIIIFTLWNTIWKISAYRMVLHAYNSCTYYNCTTHYSVNTFQEHMFALNILFSACSTDWALLYMMQHQTKNRMTS